MITSSMFFQWPKNPRPLYCRWGNPHETPGAVRLGFVLRSMFLHLFPGRELAKKKYDTPTQAMLKMPIIDATVLDRAFFEDLCQ